MSDPPRGRSVGLASLRGAGALLQRLPRGLAVLPVGAWMALIWSLSSLPSDGEPRPPWMGWVSNLAHAPLFGLLALWLALALPRRNGWPRLDVRGIGAIVVLVGVWGVVDELHQSTVVGRHASVPDVLTDLTGAACTLWIAAYVGSGEANERGLWKRLGLGILACCLAALLAN